MDFYDIIIGFYRKTLLIAFMLAILVFPVAIALSVKGLKTVSVAATFACMLCLVLILYKGIIKKMRNFSFCCPQCGIHLHIDLLSWKATDVYICPCGYAFRKNYEFMHNGALPSKVWESDGQAQKNEIQLNLIPEENS